MLNVSFDLSYAILALLSVPLLGIVFYTAVGLVLTAMVALSILVGLIAGSVLFGIASAAMLPFLAVGAAGLTCWLLLRNLTKDEGKSLV
jgi:hypothetical protein